MERDSQPGGRRLDISDPGTSAAAKRAFFRIVELWKISNDQSTVLLGSPSRSTVFSWKKGEGGPLSRDALERVSYIIGIYKALQVLFPDPTQADNWIRQPNEMFGGRSALDHMLGGNVADLHRVRAYVDHVRGGRS
jgi:hypothetical protein